MTLEEAFKGLPTFATDRLRVRPLRESDAEAIFAIKGNPLATEPYGAEPHGSLHETERWVKDRLTDYQIRDSMLWVLSPKEKDEAIGSCCYWHFDVESKSAEVGYELHPEYWHQGLMLEALAPVLAFGFGGIGLHRIEACPLAENKSSNNLLHKLGFEFEGTLRQRVLFRGRFIDLHYYSLLLGELRPNSTA